MIPYIAAKPINDENELIQTIVFSIIPLVLVVMMFLFLYLYKRRKIPQFSHVSK